MEGDAGETLLRVQQFLNCAALLYNIHTFNVCVMFVFEPSTISLYAVIHQCSFNRFPHCCFQVIILNVHYQSKVWSHFPNLELFSRILLNEGITIRANTGNNVEYEADQKHFVVYFLMTSFNERFSLLL